MIIKPGTDSCSGVSITLTGEEIVTAIYAYLVAHDVNIRGCATFTVNGELFESGHIYVDPSGFVVAKGELLGKYSKILENCIVRDGKIF